MELGGFAEYPEVIDGDFNAFNYGTAELYVDAFYEEDFKAIGEIDEVHFRDICYWYDYQEGLNHKNIVDEIKKGTFITKNNRTIIDAIYENKNLCLSEIYVKEKVFSPKLILICLLYGNLPINIFTYSDNEEEYKIIFKELFDLIDLELERVENKKEFLESIRNNISRIRYGNINTKKYISTISKNYEFVKKIRNDKKS